MVIENWWSNPKLLYELKSSSAVNCVQLTEHYLLLSNLDNITVFKAGFPGKDIDDFE